MGAGVVSEDVSISTWGGKKPSLDLEELEDGRIFEPTETVAWLIGISNYDEVRQVKPAYLDIDQAPKDVARMEDFFEEIGFHHIIKTENADRDELALTYSRIAKILAAGHRDKTNSKKVLLYCYYSGHGVMDNTTKVVTNEEEAELRYYSLES